MRLVCPGAIGEKLTWQAVHPRFFRTTRLFVPGDRNRNLVAALGATKPMAL